MNAVSWFTVAEAAARLGVSPQRVHALIQQGALDARRLGREFLVDPASVQRRLSTDLLRHRPLDPRHAWALIALASQDDALPVDRYGLSSWAWSRIRGRLKYETLLELAPRLRRRADVHSLRADPGDLQWLASREGLVRTGVSAAREHGLDVVAPDVLEAYALPLEAACLIRQFALEPSARPNVILHEVKGDWPFAPHAIVAPGLLTALDLYDSDDARTRRAGFDYLQQLARP